MTNSIESMSISEFKATCLAVLERVRRSGKPILITRRGEPIAEIVPSTLASARTSWLGSVRGTARIIGDLVEPALPAEDLEVTGG